MEILYFVIFAASYKVLHAMTKLFVTSPAVNAVVNEQNFNQDSKRFFMASIPLLPIISLAGFMSNNLVRENLLFNFTAILLCLFSGEFFIVNNTHKGSEFCFHSTLMIGAIHLSMFLMALINVYIHLFELLLRFLFGNI